MGVSKRRSGKVRPRGRFARIPLAESLESRSLLAVFQVVNDFDGGPGSLRQAMMDSNATPGRDSITFSIPIVQGANVATIPLIGELPRLTDPVEIDATTQPGYAGFPLIELDGSNVNGGSGDGLTILGGDSVVRGLAITRFSREGIAIAGPGGNLVERCFVGIGAEVLAKRGNGNNGIQIDNSPDNTIGGAAIGAGNTLSGNTANGLRVFGPNSARTLIQNNVIGLDRNSILFAGNGSNGITISSSPDNVIRSNIVSGNSFAGILLIREPSKRNLVQGNIIGTNRFNTPLTNSIDGIQLIESPDNTIGGTTPETRNVVSGNGGAGISLRGPNSTANLVIGNFVGTDLTGVGRVPNVSDGIFIQNAPRNTIGGLNAGESNVVSNNRIGINVSTLPDSQLGPDLLRFFRGGSSDRNLIIGNKIGSDVSGTSARPNFQDGISIFGGVGNTIGGLSTAAANLVSGNFASGIGLVGPSTRETLIVGNLIGLRLDGLVRLSNGGDGILIDGAVDNTVGGVATGSRNLVSGNEGGGVRITGNGASRNLIVGNHIGIGSTGVIRLGNNGDGVLIDQDASMNTVGGLSAAARNVISANGASAVQIARNASRNLVVGNYLGLAPDGFLALGNNLAGVLMVDGASLNTVGGAVAGSGNAIAENVVGVIMNGPFTRSNVVQGNLIGTDASGLQGRGNDAFGVLVTDGSSNNTIGGVNPLERNVISSNGQGVSILGPEAANNVIQGNLIGLDRGGFRPLGNLQNGIFIGDSRGNLIGGDVPGAGNVVSSNQSSGIQLSGLGAFGNRIQGNFIGTDASGDRTDEDMTTPFGNVLNGILLENAPDNTIGGTTPTARNVIANNRSHGIRISGPNGRFNQVIGNFIGVDASGTRDVGNLLDGVYIFNASLNRIGGASPGERNVISGNNGNGVQISGPPSRGNRVSGNFLGTDAAGRSALGNGRSGVLINQAPENLLGGETPGERNVASGNGEFGINVLGPGAEGTRIVGNIIGADPSGTNAVANLADGILFNNAAGSVAIGNLISGNIRAGVEILGVQDDGVVLLANRVGVTGDGLSALGNEVGILINGSSNNRVGSDRVADANLISGNDAVGVLLRGLGATGNSIQGNHIGVDVSLTKSLPNMTGVFIEGAQSNFVGGDQAGEGNLISGNIESGVQIFGGDASGNRIRGNLIGTSLDGSQAFSTASPQQAGVIINDAADNEVGSDAGTGGNVISGNVAGLVIVGFSAKSNKARGNTIGLDRSGKAAVPNLVGVYLNGASSNTIGGSTVGERNVISGNQTVGVSIFGALSTKNVISGNYIGTDVSGTSALPNSTGIFIENSPANVVGGSSAAFRNVISGNAIAGIYILGLQSTGNLVRSNFIGLSADGKPGLGNKQYGVLLFNAPRNTVDKSRALGNKISGSGIGDLREFTGLLRRSGGASARAAAKRFRTVLDAIRV